MKFITLILGLLLVVGGINMPNANGKTLPDRSRLILKDRQYSRILKKRYESRKINYLLALYELDHPGIKPTRKKAR